MKPVFIYAIRHTDPHYLKSALIDAIRDINDDKIERFIEMVLGCQPIYTFPAKVYSCSKTIIRVFKSIDYLNDRVYYTYEDTITKFFMTQEEADNYATIGNYISSRSSNSKTNDCTIEASYTHIRENYISINEWLNSEVVID